MVANLSLSNMNGGIYSLTVYIYKLYMYNKKNYIKKLYYNIVPISFLILVVHLILTSILPPLTPVIKVIRGQCMEVQSGVQSAKKVLTLEAKQKWEQKQYKFVALQ